MNITKHCPIHDNKILSTSNLSIVKNKEKKLDVIKKLILLKCNNPNCIKKLARKYLFISSRLIKEFTNKIVIRGKSDDKNDILINNLILLLFDNRQALINKLSKMVFNQLFDNIAESCFDINIPTMKERTLANNIIIKYVNVLNSFANKINIKHRTKNLISEMLKKYNNANKLLLTYFITELTNNSLLSEYHSLAMIDNYIESIRNNDNDNDIDYCFDSLIFILYSNIKIDNDIKQKIIKFLRSCLDEYTIKNIRSRNYYIILNEISKIN